MSQDAGQTVGPLYFVLVVGALQVPWRKPCDSLLTEGMGPCKPVIALLTEGIGPCKSVIALLTEGLEPCVHLDE